jgi:hypothetical protein
MPAVSAASSQGCVLGLTEQAQAVSLLMSPTRANPVDNR